MATIPYPVHVPLEEHSQTIFYVVLSLLGMDVQVEVATHKGRIDAVVHMLSTIYVFDLNFMRPQESGYKPDRRKKNIINGFSLPRKE